ncbi:uncharacterized protein BROUX77_002484 [Berkeleyomyces rouxiae]|uniref:uncharacterized protein n=1 Tax=Berkeleyomyces rouxiae TaxID=2035830 RepID=UPI003B7EF952
MVAIDATILAQLGLLNGCVLDLNALLNVAVCPSIAVSVPASWTPATTGDALSLVNGLVKRAPTCPTTVTVDPLSPSLGLGQADTVSLQLALGVLDLLNVNLGLNLDLLSLLDLIVKLNINLLDLVNLDLNLNAGLGNLLDALLNLNLGVNVGQLLDLKLDLGVDLTPLTNAPGGTNAPVTLGNILDLVNNTVTDVTVVVDKLLTGLAPVVNGLLGTVDGVVGGLLNTVGSLLGGLLGKRQTPADVLTAAALRRRQYTDAGYGSEPAPAAEPAPATEAAPASYGNNEATANTPATEPAPSSYGNNEASANAPAANEPATNTPAGTTPAANEPAANTPAGTTPATNGPTHPIVYKPTCGSCLSPSAPNVVEVPVASLNECVSQCHLAAANGLLNVLVGAQVNVLNAINVNLCLAVSLLSDATTGQQTCRFLTGTGATSTAPASAFVAAPQCTSYQKA